MQASIAKVSAALQKGEQAKQATDAKMEKKKLYLDSIKYNGIPGATPSAVATANATGKAIPAAINKTAAAVKQIAT
jgi:hypothetical protein